MTNFIPIFPLGIVVYPGEELNLHIFEPRYKQLIRECHETQKPFGIPAVIENKLHDFGSLVSITAIVKEHDNGEMDIRTRGSRVFRILEVIKEIPDKLYSGAIVNYPDNEEAGNREKMRRIMSDLRELHRVLQVSKSFSKKEEELVSYDVAHHAGLSLQEEYELLTLMQEKQRQEYLQRHLNKAVAAASRMEELKEKIKLNGHFKELKGFDL
ncbi:MAG TPA: LON peptidase substrate-binding domain-containing protein [Chitinophagaceae bacterium]|nr:LON peptidase substrate-binding domain-containing protein [Chitinophagaceae bacterium]